MKETVRTADYDDIAHEYDRRWTLEDFSGLERAVREMAGADPRREVLEVGCGTGHWLAVLRDLGVDAVGLDPSAAMLTRAATKIPRRRLVAARAEQLPFDEGAFDLVYSVNALHHFRGQREFLSEACRVLRSGGRLMTIGLDPHAGTDHWFIYDYFPQTWHADRERYPATTAIRRWLEELGFICIRTSLAQHVRTRIPAQRALETGRLDKRSTSQLVILTDGEYEAGLARLRRDLEAAGARHETLYLEADLRLYATYAQVP